MNRRFTLVVVAQGGRLCFWRFHTERAAADVGEWLRENRIVLDYYIVDDLPS